MSSIIFSPTADKANRCKIFCLRLFHIVVIRFLQRFELVKSDLVLWLLAATHQLSRQTEAPSFLKYHGQYQMKQ